MPSRFWDKDAAMRLGIDLGGTKTEIIALAEAGSELYRKRVDTPSGSYDAIVAAMAGLVAEAESKLGQRGTVQLHSHQIQLAVIVVHHQHSHGVAIGLHIDDGVVSRLAVL